MVNPHISLNLQNPQFHGAILRFSEDFYCEIHRFHWQSSDLAQRIYLVRSLSDLRSSSALSGCQFDSGDSVIAFYTTSVSSDKLRFAEGVQFESWISQLGHRSEHRSEYRSVSGHFP